MGNVMFMVNATDYTDDVIAEQFMVRSIPQYKSWQDANGREHRSVFRTQIEGSFTLYFDTITAFDNFCTLLDSVQNNDTSYPCTVWVNNKNTSITSNYFIDFDAERFRDGAFADQVGKLKISIKER